MSKKSEDSLERFFRKAVKQYDTPFLESDWQKMEKMLDDKAIEQAAFRAKLFRQAGFSIIALLLLVGSYYFLSFSPTVLSTDDDRKLTQAAAGAEAPADGAKQISPAADLRSSFNKASDQEISASKQTTTTERENVNRDQTQNQLGEAIVSNQSTSETNSANASKSATTRQNKSEQTHRNPAIRETSDATLRSEANNRNIFNSEVPTISKQNGFSRDQEKIISDVAAGDKSQIQTPVVTADHDISNNQDSKNESSSPILITKDTVAKEADISKAIKQEVSDQEKNQEPAQSVQHVPTRWSAALKIAPDFTSSVLGKYSSPGEAIGVMINFRILDRLAINSGLLRSSKKYVGKGSDYSPPPGYWAKKTNGIIPEEINGSCLVYELPVIVTYDFVQKQKTRVFVGAGVSSYIMSSQLYKYEFAQDNPGAATGWSTSVSEKYPFNIGHLSLGYERQIFPKLSLGLEPYLKVPFSGMGWSDVDLYSTGIFINVRYRLLKKVLVDENKKLN
jgi:hypothetical protein